MVLLLVPGQIKRLGENLLEMAGKFLAIERQWNYGFMMYYGNAVARYACHVATNNRFNTFSLEMGH